MKKLFVLIIAFIVSAGNVFAADSTLPAMTADTVPVSTDIIYKVNAGGDAERKSTLGNAITKAHGLGNWKWFYTDGSGVINAISVGAAGTIPVFNGAAAAPTVSAFTLAAPGVQYAVLGSDGTNWIRIATSADIQTLLGSANFAAAKGYLSVDDLVTLSGVADGAINLGTFTGSTIADNQTIKAALQALETSVESKLATNGSAASLTSFPTLNQTTTGTAGGLTAAYVDWTAGSGGASILNKPTLGTMAAETATNYVPKSTYDAHTVLYATTDNTPAALTVGEQTVVGRVTSGNIAAIAIDSDISSVSASDDTVPSAKATKTALDLKAPLSSPTFTNTPAAPTAAADTNSTQIATTAQVYSTLTGSALNWVTTGTISGKIPTVVNSASGTVNVSVAQARATTFFLNTYAGTTTFNLPAAEAGMAVCIKNGQGVSQVLRLDTDGSDYIVMSTGARTSAAGDYYEASASASNQACVVAFDATDWYITSSVGTWTEQ